MSKKDKGGPFITGFSSWKPIPTSVVNKTTRTQAMQMPDEAALAAGGEEEKFAANLKVTMTTIAAQDDQDESLPPRVYSSLVECNGTLYLVGGTDFAGKPLSTVYSSCGPLSEWMEHAPLQRAKAGMCTHAIGGKIFVLGGSNSSQKGDNEVEIFDPLTNSWRKGQTLPGDTFTGYKSVYHNGLIYIVGGVKDADSSCLNKIFAYNPERDEWTLQKFPDLNFYRYAPSLFVKDDQLFITGGREGKIPCSGNEVYSFDDNQVRMLPSLPDEAKNVFHGSASRDADHDFYLMGGMQFPQNPPVVSANMNRFDVRSLTWEAMPNMMNARADFGSVVFGNKILVIGGLSLNNQQQARPINDIEVFVPEEKTWYKMKNTMPTPRFAPHLVNFNHKLFVLGGFSGDRLVCALEKLEIK